MTDNHSLQNKSPRKSIRKVLLISLTVIVLLTLFSALLIISYRLLYLDTYKDQIIAVVEKSLNRHVTYRTGNLSFQISPTFTFTNVAILEKNGQSVFVSSERINFKIALFPLLEKRIVLKEVSLEHPYIKLFRDKNGKFNFSDIMEGKKEATPLQIRNIRISGGFATLTDQAISPQGVTTSLDQLNLSTTRIFGRNYSDFALSAAILEKGGNSPVLISGKIKFPSKEKSWSDTDLNLKVSGKGLNAAHFWDYYGRYVPFRKILCRIDINSNFKGKLSDFSSRGSVRLSGLYFDYPQVFRNPLTPKDVRIKYDMELTAKDLSVKNLSMNVDGLSVKGSCSLLDMYSRDLLIDAKAVTNSFNLEHFAGYIPFGIIPSDTSQFIEKHIKGGIYKLQEGRLKGRVSQIAHMEKGTNYNVLFIKGTVGNGLVAFENVPTFNSIRGKLALQGKDFILDGMEGRFGTSPFKLEGRIADYPLDSPSGYPFTMTMTPGPAEVTWLLDGKNTGKLAFSGQSTLHLSGNGFSSNYALSGRWDLTAAAYKYSDIVNKSAGQPNSLMFKGSIGKEEARVSSLYYTLNSLALDAGGTYSFAREKQLVFFTNTNQFLIQDIAPMAPRIGKFLPKGKVRLSVKGKYKTTDPDSLVLNGDAILTAVSLKPADNMKFLENINGDIRFTGDSVRSSLIAAKFGNSTVYVSGNLSGFKNPSLNLSFSSPRLDLPDLGLRNKTKMVTANNVHGAITFKEGNLNIKGISGQINKSVINLHGTVEDIHNPKLAISLTSPYLEFDDIMLLKGLEEMNKREPSPSVSGEISILAESGKIKQFQFSKLNSRLLLSGKTVYIYPVEMNVAGGTISARGQMYVTSNEKPRYRVSFDMKNLSAPQVLQALQTKREVTGSISSTGDLSARGETVEEIKKSIQGDVKLICTDGSLRKFAVLSKIFSILNVSQLLKFQLPDMVSGGMPYNKITGTFSFQNGIASTDNLFIDSDAMNISVIGKFDIPKEELDLTIGVKPLQTVDKVISHIPIVGWILTGKNKSLVTAYFEAKGTWDNPHVSAIPVKALAKGVFGIFKRVFQLPAKLITDTGEVIIGK